MSAGRGYRSPWRRARGARACGCRSPRRRRPWRTPARWTCRFRCPRPGRSRSCLRERTVRWPWAGIYHEFEGEAGGGQAPALRMQAPVVVIAEATPRSARERDLGLALRVLALEAAVD